ncbi:MAG TPA: cupin domain-containing protein [candidate division Zixibacteria bacterium]|nr:cupin domain-containing protein [candidate division Zixibacteria bacterium]
MIKKISLSDKFKSFDDVYVPKIVGELNGQYLKVVKCLGEYVWHRHKTEDEMFLVINGNLKILLRNGEVELNEGEFCIIPHGVEHKPIAGKLCHVMIFEPSSTRNTGQVQHKYTIEAENLEKI